MTSTVEDTANRDMTGGGRGARLLASEPELEVSLEAAAVLVSLAMRDTQHPVTDLGNALTRISQRLHARGHSGDSKRLCELIAGDLAACIQSLQFHDRLMQQLGAVRSFLAGPVDQAAFDTDGFGALRWEELLRVLRERLSDDSQHELFRSLMRNEAFGRDPRTDAATAAEGSVELF
jgi:hypothetical protein